MIEASLKRVTNYLKILTLPKSSNDDLNRRQFILNILLLSILFLLLIVSINNTIRFFGDPEYYKNNVLSELVVYAIFSVFLFLYFLSRKGFFTVSAYFFIGIFLFSISYTVCKWGVQLPTGLLSYALIIVISGILINAQFAFITTFISSVIIFIISYLQINKVIIPNSAWKNEVFNFSDILVLMVIFSIISIVSWLSNREIEKSLARARASEAELKKERDSLEATVETRTKELKEIQAEKISQLYRFAEFGRLSSGVFHDLINPLTAISLNMEKLKRDSQVVHGHPAPALASQRTTAAVSDAAVYVDQAVRATKKLEDLVVAVRKQLARQQNSAIFSLNNEIECVIEVLGHKSKKAGVQMQFSCPDEISMFGDAVRFNQVALNLITNAIDAYDGSLLPPDKRDILVALRREHNAVVLSVQDFGTGILPEHMSKIFEPFFTTKAQGRGIGIGLSMTSHIVQKDFKGSIAVESNPGKGTVFNVAIPAKG